MSDEDPFERLNEDVEDREGDPFEYLADEREGEDDEDAADLETISEDLEPDYDGHDVTPADHRDEADASETTDDEPVERKESTDGEPVVREEPTVDTGRDTGTFDPDDPFAGIGSREGDPFDDDIFEEMDTGGLDPDEVWESLSEAERRGSVTEMQDQTYAEVSKHSYCEQCEFFSEPPAVSCSHDGTEILEFIDHDTVRVVDCPVVTERRELEEHE